MSLVINNGRRVRSVPAAAPSISAPTPLTPYFRKWVRVRNELNSRVRILEEACTKDARPLAALRSSLIDHHVRLDIVERMGYVRAAAVLRNRLAADKRTRSGDLGEVLATEYVDEMTEFQVPIRRLRHRDDRSMAMRGDDVIGIALASEDAPKILKVESKSRAAISTSVVREAGEALAKHSGRPNPSTHSAG